MTKFQGFLKANDYSADIVWVQPEDVHLTGTRFIYVRVPASNMREKMVQQVYQEGMARRRGVLFGTICKVGDRTCSYVWAPRNEDEAARALMPAGLKMSAKTDKVTGSLVKNDVLWACLKFLYSRKQALREELFR